jgi:hypothetical protein
MRPWDGHDQLSQRLGPPGVGPEQGDAGVDGPQSRPTRHGCTSQERFGCSGNNGTEADDFPFCSSSDAFAGNPDFEVFAIFAPRS